MDNTKTGEAIGCTDTICEEVSRREFTQRDIALSYALALRLAAAGADTPNWGQINRAILGRWKMSGLERIKKMAVEMAKRGTVTKQ